MPVLATSEPLAGSGGVRRYRGMGSTSTAPAMKLHHAFLLALAGHASTASATEWPHGAKGAVVLTYDDSLDSQLDHAVPALDAAGFKGTFFLSEVKKAQVPRWRAVARAAHELANHSLFHPCAAATYPADPRYTTEAYTPATMIREIAQQEAMLTALDGRDRHGFGAPCGQTTAGGVDYLAPLRAAGLVSYIRGAAASPGEAADRFHVPARSFPDGVSGAQLIEAARAAERDGKMAVFVFHGVGGDYLQVSDAAHRALIVWLKAHRRDVWVATLEEALAWMEDHPGG